jgi:lipocalin-like protein
MPKFIISVVLAIVSFQSQSAAQTGDKLIGTWKLVSAKITTDKGEVRDFWGPTPVGFLLYTEDGRMSAILTLGNRKPLSVSDFISLLKSKEPRRSRV